MATGTDPAKRPRFDLFTEHVGNTHRWNGGRTFDGKSMGDTGQIYSEAPRPGCQKVLEINACVGFTSILPKDYGKEKNSENLAGTQARYGQYLQDLCRTMWVWQAWMAQSRPASDPMFSTTTTTPRQIVSGRGLHGLWMFGEASNGRASPVYQP
ncbi:hypothetical protein HO173_013352 [Letharia columbiana]|uniref:Uncharacterized protein n=1 Tax=Letharia columbiana TaxID=112416 RepID=A0A8H6FC94_9LECA|nr:uncharacterized protein HO173_013352 [Letharia columbiana]KAF6223070.1 hypothetical protein HO173_013352 [Letharia columbiana]